MPPRTLVKASHAAGAMATQAAAAATVVPNGSPAEKTPK